MGPRSIERGRTGTNTAMAGNISLQWGRAQLSAEGLCYDEIKREIDRLQWGRAQLSAEGPICELFSIPYELLQWGRAQLSAEGTI